MKVGGLLCPACGQMAVHLSGLMRRYADCDKCRKSWSYFDYTQALLVYIDDMAVRAREVARSLDSEPRAAGGCMTEQQARLQALQIERAQHSRMEDEALAFVRYHGERRRALDAEIERLETGGETYREPLTGTAGVHHNGEDMKPAASRVAGAPPVSLSAHLRPSEPWPPPACSFCGQSHGWSISCHHAALLMAGTAGGPEGSD